MNTCRHSVILFCIFLLVRVGSALVLPAEQSALQDIYTALGGTSWVRKDNWLNSTAGPCTWYGITCFNTGQVDVVVSMYVHFCDRQFPDNLSSLSRYLAANNLVGTIPQSIGSFAFLRYLDLSQNSISGTIPEAIGLLTSLTYLSLGSAYYGLNDLFLDNMVPSASYNRLEGTIPASIGNLTQLQTLVLQKNQLSGTIPATIANLKQLQVFYAATNQLTGSTPWLPKLTSLRFFDIGENTMTGPLPPLSNLTNLVGISLSAVQLNQEFPGEDICKLSKLESLHLDSAGLTGTLPNCLGNLPLKYITMSSNELTGTIPSTFSQLTNLSMLALGGNLLHGTIPDLSTKYRLFLLSLQENDIEGTLPEWLGTLPALSYLYTYKMKLSGSIPTSLAQSLSLQLIQIGGNRLTGTIPSFGGYPPFGQPLLATLDLSHNMLTGTLPSTIGTLPSLKSLIISSNNVSGTLDFVCLLGNTTLQISIDSNRFTGTIPACIGNLHSLQLLDLSNNQISGSIPTEMGRNSQLQILKLSNNALTGAIPVTFSNLTALSQLILTNNPLGSNIVTMFGPLGNLPALSKIDMSNTSMTGVLTNQIFSPASGTLFRALVELNLANNMLTGPISQGLGNLPSIVLIDLRNNLLEGIIPDKLEKVSVLKFSGNAGVRSPYAELPAFMKAILPLQMDESGRFACPTLTGREVEQTIDLQPSYYNYTLCQCAPGYHGANGSCLPCLEHAVCRGGRVVMDTDEIVRVEPGVMVVKEGYFPEPSPYNIEKLVPCYHDKLNSYPCNPDESYPFQCKKGYHDRLCARCEEGYFSANRECKKCPSVLPELTLAVLVIALIVIYIYLLKSRGGEKMEMSIYLKSFFFYLQTTSILLSRTTFAWPSALLVLNSIFTFTNISLSFFTCINVNLFSVSGNYFILWAAPAVFVFVSAMIFFAGLLYYTLKDRMQTKQRGAAADSNQSETQPLTLAAQWRYGCVRATLTAVNLVYFPLCVLLVQIFNCDKDPYSGDKYLTFSPWETCEYVPEYTVKFALAIIGTLTYIIGVPVLFGYLMYRVRNIRGDPAVRLWFGWFYFPYKDKYFWYEFIAIGRRSALGILVGSMGSGSSLIPMIMFAVLSISTGIHAFTMPYHIAMANYLELAGLALTLLLFVSGLIFSGDLLANQFVGLEIVLLVLNAGFVVLCATVILRKLVIFIRTKMGTSSYIRPIDDEEQGMVMKEKAGSPRKAF